MVVPSSGPAPEERLSVTFTVAVKPIVERLPNWSCDLITGCVPKGVPVEADPGCVVKISDAAFPTTSDSVPKLLPPDPFEFVEVVMPLMTAVPPPVVGLKIWPAAMFVPVRGLTWIAEEFPIVIWSELAVPLTVITSVRFVLSPNETEAETMSRAEVNVTFGTWLVLNSKPRGVRRMNVIFVPVLKSNLLPSVTVIAPSVVQAGNVASAAVSAEILIAPVAGVTDALAKLDDVPPNNRQSAATGLEDRTSFARPTANKRGNPRVNGWRKRLNTRIITSVCLIGFGRYPGRLRVSPVILFACPWYFVFWLWHYVRRMNICNPD